MVENLQGGLGEQHRSAESDHDFANDEISLLDLAIVLAKNKRLIIGLPLFAGVAAIAATLLMAPIFTATTKILPPQQSSSTASAMLAQLGGLAGLAGSATGIKNPNDLYVAMMQSRTVGDKLIDRFSLMTLWKAEFRADAQKRLDGGSKISSGKDGIITIEVEDEDPKRAADIANAYVNELHQLTKVLAVTEASQRRLFFEEQLLAAKDNLTRAEIAAREGLSSGGLVKVDDQGRAMIEITARLRGQIAVKEIQIGAMRTYAAEGNPDLRAAQQELVVMKSELTRAEGAGRSPVSKSPGKGNGSGIETLNLLRDVKYFETIYELLARQYEIAKIDEAKDSATIQVLDTAVPPERRSKPKRVLIVLLAMVAAGFLAVVLAFVREAMARMQQDPAQRERLEMLRLHLR